MSNLIYVLSPSAHLQFLGKFLYTYVVFNVFLDFSLVENSGNCNREVTLTISEEVGTHAIKQRSTISRSDEFHLNDDMPWVFGLKGNFRWNLYLFHRLLTAFCHILAWNLHLTVPAEGCFN